MQGSHKKPSRHTREISYVSYRGVAGVLAGRGDAGINTFGKTRLDFYLISLSILGTVQSVRYADRLSGDFDHKEVLLNICRKLPAGKIMVYDSTLKDEVASRIGVLGMYEVCASHLQEKDAELDRNVIQLDILIRNAELINILRDTNQGGEELDNRYQECLLNMDLVIERMRGMNVLEREFGGYGYRTLYGRNDGS